MPRRALFLDRDGVINVDHGYVHRVEQVKFLPGIFELARFASRELRWPLVVVTNQAGIGRNYYDEAAFQSLTEWMRAQFEAQEAPISRVYHCPYHPEFGIGKYRLDHPWRKPKPGMFLQAAKDLDLDLLACALVGDTMNDIYAGAAAGVGLRIRLDAAAGLPPADAPSHEVARDLGEALAILRRSIQSTSGDTSVLKSSAVKDH
jgi:D-glycero-D-manno-heptose 1,7-bisphosphate phosphatase